MLRIRLLSVCLLSMYCITDGDASDKCTLRNVSTGSSASLISQLQYLNGHINEKCVRVGGRRGGRGFRGLYSETSGMQGVAPRTRRIGLLLKLSRRLDKMQVP